MVDIPEVEFRWRLERVQESLEVAGLDVLLVTPGANLRYLTGYAGMPLERITCLVLPAGGDPVLLAPELEVPLVRSKLVADLEIVAWAETDDSIGRLVALLPRSARRIAVDDQMWAVRVLAVRHRLPDVDQVTAAPVLGPMRMRKTPTEVEALRVAAAMIDRVHEHMGDWLAAGRTEREVGDDIAAAILAAGHERVEFVIVASGPNAASPHADVSDRLIRPGEPIVVDIGGLMPDGYCSDSTRTYVLGEPPVEFAAYYEVLRAAQDAQCRAARPGITAAALDAIGRELITAAGYGREFLHRTGHGIGLEVHEDPYIVAGNEVVLESGMTFSVEPGIYVAGRHGARIEDIVVCVPAGEGRLNLRPRELAVL